MSRPCPLAVSLAITWTLTVLGAAELHVSPVGDDAHPGSAQQPRASLDGARRAVRRLLAQGARDDITVWFQGGIYPLTAPVTFTPEDSAREGQRITYAAHPGATPVFSGGRRITGWRQDGSIWKATIPEVKSGTWRFRCLYVDDARRTLARMPDEGAFFRMDGPGPDRNTSFIAIANHLRRWPDIAQGDIVGIAAWESYILPVEDYVEASRLVTVKGRTPWEFKQGQRYFIENIAGALDAPGEWHCDRQTGILSYIPIPGEDMAKAVIVAPLTQEFLAVAGTPERPVRSLHFNGLQFRHGDYALGPEGHGDRQAAQSVPGAIRFSHARNCGITDAVISQIGLYGIDVGDGCQGIRIAGNELHDCGAGGVSIRSGSSGTVVHNNFIHDTGRIHYGAVAVLVQDSGSNAITHNEICDTTWAGICLGWTWGFQPTQAHDNLVAFNHLHHLGRGLTTDLGAIYTLGISSGTVIRNNLMHHIWDQPEGYLACGIYPDEGSTGLLIEDNIVHQVTTGGLHVHFGRDNVVRNNIFAFGRFRQVFLGRGKGAGDKEERKWLDRTGSSLVFERNIVLYNRGHVFGRDCELVADRNLYWNMAGPVAFKPGVDLAAWQAQGRDAQGLVADPLFVDPLRGDFRFRPGSPAIALGFKPIDMSTVGLVGTREWIARPQRIVRPEAVFQERTIVNVD